MNSIIDRETPCRRLITSRQWLKISGDRDVRSIAYCQIKQDFAKFTKPEHECTIVEFNGSNECEGAWLLYSSLSV